MHKAQRTLKRKPLIGDINPTGRILVDWEIREYAKKCRMIEPFEERLKREGVISYGLSSMGYDIRLTDDYKIFTNVRTAVVDPKQFSPDSFVDFKGSVCTIPPNSFALARSVEYFRLPRSVLGICLGKSSYARCGIVVNITPLEPCYDRDTEILTEEGWKKFSGLSGKEQVATLDAHGELEYQKILKMHRYAYRGKLVAIRGRNIDLAVTPAHLLLVKKRWGQQFEFLPAQQVYGKYNYELKRDAVWNCKTLRVFTLPALGDRPAVQIPIDPWLRFLGFWLAEGSCYWRQQTGDYKIKIACFDERNKRWIAAVLKELPIHAIPIDTGFLIQNKQLYTYLSQFGHAPEKFIPHDIKMLPPQQLRILLDALMRGDGNRQTLTYTTTSKRLADDVQEIIMKAGWAAIVRRLPKALENRRRRFLNGHRIRHNFDVYKIRVSKRQLTPKIYKHSFSTMDYHDTVYDVTVPNHTLYVRRNGKPCWSSNCWEGHLTIEISNTTPLPARIYSGEGIAQVLFFEAGSRPEVSYADRKGKYQGQTGITLPKV